MRLALLIVVAVVILAGAAGSYFHYRTWRENRYDDLIVEVAARHEVDPALVKALIKTQTDVNFAVRLEDPDESRGLMLVPKRAADKYLEQHGRTRWGYICIHRHHRNHDPAKPEQFTSDKPANCKAPGCGQRLVEELYDPETNLEVACWYLSQAARMLRDKVKPEEFLTAVLMAYRWGLADPKEIKPTPEQRAFIKGVLQYQAKFRPSFERRARRAAGR